MGVDQKFDPSRQKRWTAPHPVYASRAQCDLLCDQRWDPMAHVAKQFPQVAKRLSVNWLRVLDTAKRSQVDHRVCHQLHAIMPLLDTFKAEQQPLEFVLPRKGPLDPHA